MPDAEIIAAVRNKYQALRPVLDEKVRRRWAACEALAIGWGASPRSRRPLASLVPPFEPGLAEVQGGASDAERTRMPSGNGSVRWAEGRRRVTESAPGLLKALQALLEASTRGEPQSPLLWTSKAPGISPRPSRNKATK